jgi:hypothetical protein
MTSKHSRYVSAGMTVTLVAMATLAYGYRARQAYRIATSSGAIVDTGRLGSMSLRDLASNAEVRLQPADGKPLLVVFLSTADCSGCLFQTEVWNELIRQRAPVHVAAVVVRSSLNEAAQYVRSFRPAFPVYFDSGGDLPQLAGIPDKTPFKVLLDAGGRPLLASESSTDDRAFIAQVMGVVGRGHNGGSGR